MTPKELLKDRYKVIAKYLFSPYEIGDVIEPDDCGGVFLANVDYTQMGEERKVAYFYDINDCALYPALFRKLRWDEDRDIKDMPEFVYNKVRERFYKVLNPVHDGREFHNDFEVEMRFFLSRISDYIPATKEEFENQNKPA